MFFLCASLLSYNLGRHIKDFHSSAGDLFLSSEIAAHGWSSRISKTFIVGPSCLLKGEPVFCISILCSGDTLYNMTLLSQPKFDDLDFDKSGYWPAV